MRKADNLTTFMCRLSWNLGASTNWNPQGLSRAVQALPLVDGSGWSTPRSGRLTPGEPFVQEARWTREPVWTDAENFATTGIQSVDRPVRSRSLCSCNTQFCYIVDSDMWLTCTHALFTLQRWIRERAVILRHTYIAQFETPQVTGRLCALRPSFV